MEKDTALKKSKTRRNDSREIIDLNRQEDKCQRTYLMDEKRDPGLTRIIHMQETLKDSEEKGEPSGRRFDNKNPKKINKGGLMMEVAGRRAQSEILKEEIRKNSPDLDVQLTRNNMTVFMNDIDADMSTD
ncbi:hypothetical protein JTB14_017838 [Gonioctena quinquepunctata]|nr:hypothetical protein JTB14_017838 [Gonioctena quinquepunctata]